MSHKQRGFSLIEMVIYIALIVGILITATSFAWTIINSKTKALVMQEVEQNGRLIVEKVAQAAHGASAVSLPGTGVAGTALELEYQDASKDPVRFSFSGSSLTMSEGAGAAAKLHSDSVVIADLQFVNVSSTDARTVNVFFTVTLEHVNPENRQEWAYSNTFETTIELRDQH
ncbi:MAG: type II secretion system protein [Patescibacteria group bacterium]